MRQRTRYRHNSLRTEQAYLLSIKADIRHHGMRHPSQMAAAEVASFLNHLVNTRRISPSTHKQALCALLFLYREGLGANLPWMSESQRPVVRELRLAEALALRVNDLDVDREPVAVRSGVAPSHPGAPTRPPARGNPGSNPLPG